LDNPEDFPKLRLSGWSDDIHAIFNSFDVLVSTSQSETFALVVAEALSAGIPCLLSDIPVYRELYSGCEGVAIMTGDDQQDILSINQLLAQADQLKPTITSYWEGHFSEETVTRAWTEKIRGISA
jgi:glycosyltransferase involved in cell wall biosynthesis